MNEPAAEATAIDETTLLRTYLSGRDCPCPFCGYNLRDALGDRCPECGETVRLGVHAVDPKIGWPMAGAIGLAAGAGFSLLMTAYIGLMFLARGQMPSKLWQEASVAIFLPLLVQSTLLWFWIKRWNRLRRLSLGRRVMWTLLAWVVPFANIVLFTSMIR